ncbi:YbjN domain-containing protein [Saccharopolyspora sp. 6M]|uniref:YbjN domain-containing protein n=1 Tax=Saccharopolyspora sp. 6M TaxID=2877237 RepID=UPI001CD39328|nr:YbjN domain-containing protein [Saccharopolyspora sp. 6M]MCA1227092.1 YbjN domain-containing protein [Saccharopolyspora sp. 6M]
MTVEATIAAALDASELDYRREDGGRFFVTLPGTKKLQTNCWLIVAEHALVVEAFVCRQPDEAHEDVYRFLLRRNARLYGVHYTIDGTGDVYLVGRIGLHAVTAEEVDRVLGQVLEAADGDFNTLLELGFGTAIRREWGWRESRGESLANLRPFEQLVRRDGPLAPADDGGETSRER